VSDNLLKRLMGQAVDKGHEFVQEKKTVLAEAVDMSNSGDFREIWYHTPRPRAATNRRAPRNQNLPTGVRAGGIAASAFSVRAIDMSSVTRRGAGGGVWKVV